MRLERERPLKWSVAIIQGCLHGQLNRTILWSKHSSGKQLFNSHTTVLTGVLTGSDEPLSPHVRLHVFMWRKGQPFSFKWGWSTPKTKTLSVSQQPGVDVEQFKLSLSHALYDVVSQKTYGYWPGSAHYMLCVAYVASQDTFGTDWAHLTMGFMAVTSLLRPWQAERSAAQQSQPACLKIYTGLFGQEYSAFQNVNTGSVTDFCYTTPRPSTPPGVF